MQPLTRTQKAAGPRDESTRNHPAWIVKCKVKDFLATWRYAFNMRLIYGLHLSYQYQIGSHQYGADDSMKNLGSNTTSSLGSNTSTIVSSIQSFFLDQWVQLKAGRSIEDHLGDRSCFRNTGLFNQLSKH